MGTITDLLLGIFLTVILVILLIVSYKIYSVFSENNVLEEENEDESMNEEEKGGESNDGDRGGGTEDRTGIEKDLEAEEGVDTTNGSLSETEEVKDDFWEGEPYAVYSLPSVARYVKTETKYLQLSLNNNVYLYQEDDFITVKMTSDPKKEHGTALQFKLCHFHLRNFPETGSYVMIESGGKFLQNETYSDTLHCSVLLRSGTPPSKTEVSDNRFFEMQPKLNDPNKVHFQHLNSGLYLATVGGFVRTRTELMYVQGEPPGRATFVPLDCENS